MTHTPGPWAIDDEAPLYERQGSIIKPGDKDTYQMIAPDVYGWGVDQAQANARLIAKAPEMLALLQRIQHVLEAPGDYSDDEHDQIRDELDTLLQSFDAKRR